MPDKQRQTFISGLLRWGVVLVFGYGAMNGCEGPRGPTGSDAVLSDTLPPWIEWITPATGDTIDTSAVLTVRAGDDQSIGRLAFSIAGFDMPPDSSVNDIFYLTWYALRYPEGPYPLVARVWDASRNASITPTILVYVQHR